MRNFATTPPGFRYGGPGGAGDQDRELRIAGFGIAMDSLLEKRRPLARACIDWTERVPHIKGSLGAALLDGFLELGWSIRGEVPRLLIITPLGAERLRAIEP